MKQNHTFNLTVTETAARCPIGETIGKRNAQENAIAVLSCEGACIRGEIARLAANRLGKEPGFRRGCHGELFAVPHSEMASWIRNAEHVVVIDGCHLKCHTRIVEHLVPRERLRRFDALARYRKFNDLFDIDSVPEAERKAIADDVAEWVHARLRDPSGSGSNAAASTSACAASPEPDSCRSKVGAQACCADSNPEEGAASLRPYGTPFGAAGRRGAPEPVSSLCGDAEPASACDAPTNRPRSQFTPQVQHLVAIGAAIAANCEPCLEHHAREADRLGVSRADMNRAVTVATRVKDAPHQKVLAAAERLTGSAAAASEAGRTSSCCESTRSSGSDSAQSCAASG